MGLYVPMLEFNRSSEGHAPNDSFESFAEGAELFSKYRRSREQQEVGGQHANH